LTKKKKKKKKQRGIGDGYGTSNLEKREATDAQLWRSFSPHDDLKAVLACLTPVSTAGMSAACA
jgi:hypothetical protein